MRDLSTARALRASWGMAALLISSVACSGEADDGTTGDTQVIDTTIVVDTVVTVDSATQDSVTVDTALQDSVTVDTSVEDTTPRDTLVPEDTAVVDTVEPDTVEVDTTPDPCDLDRTAGCPCDGDAPCADSYSCQDSVCETCAVGLASCACGEVAPACEEGAVCDPDDSLCRTCAPGAALCACRPLGSPDGRCDDDLSCLADLCVESDCDIGAALCPCGVDDSCDAGSICDAGSCRACTSGALDCVCDAGTCGAGLVCDGVSALCRMPLDCGGAGCVDRQICQAAAGADAICLTECEANYTWVAPPGRCVAHADTCDTDVAGSVGQTCAADHRPCEVHPITGVGTCGEGCLPGYVEANDACRARATCTSLDCGSAQRVCNASGDDSDDSCGDCVTDYVDVLGTCKPGCAMLACASDGKPCQQLVNQVPSCGPGCLDGWAQKSDGSCVDLVTCSELTCDHGCTAADADGGVNATCKDNTDCPEFYVRAPSGACAIRCAECDGDNDPAGAAGGYHDEAYNQTTCICHTIDSWFTNFEVGMEPCDADGDGWVRRTAFQARKFAQLNPGSPIAEEFTCDVRTIDRFLLWPDERGAMPRVVLIDDLGTLSSDGALSPVAGSEFDGISTYLELYEPDVLDDEQDVAASHGQQIGGFPPLTRYGNYAGGAISLGRAVRADELNPLTKLCNKQSDDFNRNKINDVEEWRGSAQFLTGADRWMTPYVAMSHFAELYRGFFVDRDTSSALIPGDCEAAWWNRATSPPSWEVRPCVGVAHGAYVVMEKDRSLGAAPGLELELADAVQDEASAEAGYGVDNDTTDASYWRECRRSRHADFDSSLPPDTGLDASQQQLRPGHRNFDLARFNCPAGDGSCLEADPRMRAGERSVLFDGRVPVGPRVVDHGDGPVWPGMNHHSQFRCVLPLGDGVQPSDPSRMAPYAGHGVSYQQFECSIADTQGDGPVDAATTNPSDAVFQCRVDSTPGPPTTEPQNPFYQWIRLTYSDYGRDLAGASDYHHGCVNEAVEWPFLCQGYDKSPFLNAATPTADVRNHGHIQCGCGDNGGPTCNVGCPVNAAQGRHLSHVQLDPPYNDTTRAGYWVCGDTPLTTYLYDPADYTGDPESWPASPWSFEAQGPDPQSPETTGTFAVRGQVRMSPVSRTWPTPDCVSLTNEQTGTTGTNYLCLVP